MSGMCRAWSEPRLVVLSLLHSKHQAASGLLSLPRSGPEAASEEEIWESVTRPRSSPRASPHPTSELLATPACTASSKYLEHYITAHDGKIPRAIIVDRIKVHTSAS